MSCEDPLNSSHRVVHSSASAVQQPRTVPMREDVV